MIRRPSIMKFLFLAFFATTLTLLAAAPDEGLVLSYDFGQADGGRVKDLSPRGNDGKLERGAKLEVDRHGTVLELDGVTQFASVPSLTQFQVDRGLTISAVVRFEDKNPPPDDGDMILWKPETFLLARDANGHLYFNLNDGKNWVGEVRSTAKLPVGEYVHVAATAEYVDNTAQGFAGYRVNLWINGEPAGSGQFNRATFAKNAQPVDIGKGWGGPWFFRGRIASVQLYDRALTQGDILARAAGSLYVQGVKKSAPIPAAVQARLDALTAGAGSPEEAWIIGNIARLMRDLRFAALSESLLDRAEAMQASKLGTAPNWWQKITSLFQTSIPWDAVAWWQANGSPGLRVVQGSQMHVALAVTSTHCEVAGIFDSVAQRELLGEMGSLWTAEGRDASGNKIRIASEEVPSAFSQEPQQSGDSTRFTITWKHPATPGAPWGFSARSEMKLQNRRLSMNLKVDNQSPEVVLAQVVFPAIAFRQLEQGVDTLLAPAFYGETRPDFVRKNLSYARTYPGAGATMQFGAHYDQKGGVYFGAEDPEAQAKLFTIEGKFGQLATSWRWYVGNHGKGGNSFSTSGWAAVEGFDGDWFDAGRIYKRWLEREAPWFPKLGRPDSPQWYKENTAIVQGFGQFLDDFVSYFGLPFIYHDNDWDKIGGGSAMGPWPTAVAKDNYRSEVEARQRKGISTRSYMNYRIWSQSDPAYQQIGQSSAAKNPDGSLGSTEEYAAVGGAPGLHAVMCPAAPAYQANRGALLEYMANQGIGVIYMDQMGAGEPVLCFDPTHGHSLGGGESWMKEGYWKYVPGFRQKLKSAHPELAMDTEDMAEPVANLVDGFLPWRTFAVSPGATPVPLFLSIYGGRVQFTGKSFDGNDQKAFFAITGEQLVQGEQLGYIWPNKILMSEPRSAFFKRLALTRLAMLPFFNEGEMERPLTFKGLPTFVSDWGYYGPRLMESPAIMHAVWRSPAGVALVFVNVTDSEVSAEVDFDGQRHGLVGENLTLRKADGSAADPQPVGSRFKQTLRLPPYTPEVWIISPSDAPAQPALDRAMKGLSAARAIPMPTQNANAPLSGPVNARYLRIEARYDTIQMAEFEVLSGGVNVALNKQATQSSQRGTSTNAGPMKAVDGNTRSPLTNDSANSMSATDFRAEEWWEVDLGQSFPIDSLRIHALYSEPLHERRIKALDDKREVVWDTEIHQSKPLHDITLPQ